MELVQECTNYKKYDQHGQQYLMKLYLILNENL